MKLTESYLRSLIKEVLNEVTEKNIPNVANDMGGFDKEPVSSKLLFSLEQQGYEVTDIGNGNYEIKHPTDPFESYILEPKVTKKPVPKPVQSVYNPPPRPSDDEYRQFIAMRNRNG